MLIKVEPVGFLMFMVQYCFDLERPDAEDQEVREYLLQHELDPKYEWDAEYEGRSCRWMQFGGCYLGQHFYEIGLLQRGAVEVELLTEQVSEALNGVEGLSDCRTRTILAALVSELQSESSFKVDENGELVAVLNKAELDAAVGRLLAS